MKSYTGDNLFLQLKKIIDLPDGIISLDLRIEFECIPTISILRYINKKDSLDIKIEERFELKLIENDNE